MLDDMDTINLNREVIDTLAEEILGRNKQRHSMNQAKEFISIDGENEYKNIKKAKEGDPEAIEYLQKKYSLKVYTNNELKKEIKND